MKINQSNSPTFRQSKVTDLWSFLAIVRHLSFISNECVILLSKRFNITPDSLSALVNFYGGRLLP